MSSGGNLPYQLRPNKAVERILFVDLLSRLDAVLGFSTDYEYVGMGGPQMEDFRILHERFPEMKMLSLEEDPMVVKRQRFNGPHTNIRYSQQTTADYIKKISKRPPQRRQIVWLDYTKPKDRPIQVSEFQKLIRHLPSLSIVKITLNAAAASLGGSVGEAGLQTKRLEAFLHDFGRCFPKGLDETGIQTAKFPLTLINVLEFASAESLRDRNDFHFQPVASAIYADGQTMLTLTGIIGERTRIDNVLTASRIATWLFARLKWVDPIEIDVPELTLKERICVNQLLPREETNISRIHSKLGFFLEKSVKASEAKIKQYVAFQRHYPHFGKVTI